MKIVADDKIPFLRGVLEPYAEVVYLPGAKTTDTDVRDADAILTRTRTICNSELLDGSRVKFVATATIGYDHFDTDYLARAGITWTNAPGCNSASVAQYLVSTLLNLAVKHQISLRGKTIGVVGVGNVGTKVAAAARALGMNVLLCDPPRAEAEGNNAFVDLKELLRASDFVTLHVPLTENSRHPTAFMANSDFFNIMRPDAFFINSSRGEVCRGADLKTALRNRVIRGAVLDVWENEPDLDLELLRLVDFGTPHIAGYSTDGKANGTAMVVNALSHFFNLPLTQWRPASIPGPAERDLRVKARGSFEATLLQAVAPTYDITADCGRLISAPADFERWRGDYPLRREFPYYNLILEAGLAEPEKSALLALGFNL